MSVLQHAAFSGISSVLDALSSEMLGYAEDHENLLEIVSSDLAALDQHLAQGIAGDANAADSDSRASILAAARSNVIRAFELVQAASRTPVDEAWRQGDSSADKGDLKTLQEAAALRASAVSARDTAQGKLCGLRGERAALVRRFQKLAEDFAKVQEAKEAEAEAERREEEVLEAQIEELEKQTQAIRNEVVSKGIRVDARYVLGQLFKAQRRGVAKRQARAAQEAEGAKTILALKRATDAYLVKVAEDQKEVQRNFIHEKRHLADYAETLKSQWEERCKKHSAEVEDLKETIAELERSFKESWEDGDEQTKNLLDEQERLRIEATTRLESELKTESEALRHEVKFAEEAVDHRQADLEKAGQTMLRTMEEQLASKKQEIHQRAEEELDHYAKIRTRYQSECHSLREEAYRYQQGIDFIRESYSGLQWAPQKPVPKPKARTPRSLEPMQALGPYQVGRQHQLGAASHKAKEEKKEWIS
eukprot:TRINITY_DN6560_c0_g3_i1.p1 TRINITY_DN6560_c0_g3~~TRINITY_DN6560_c0_g3_i1.p1  ORF type:complete len:478 (-),score=112.58 TRINITY_DN6560_c0_g3_i1:146-1579(-)